MCCAKRTPARRLGMSAHRLGSPRRPSVCRKGIRPSGVTELRKLRMLEEENARLKRVVAKSMLDRGKRPLELRQSGGVLRTGQAMMGPTQT